MLSDEIKSHFKSNPNFSYPSDEKSGQKVMLISWRDQKGILIAVTEQAIDIYQKLHTDDMKEKLRMHIEYRMKTYNSYVDTENISHIDHFGLITTATLGVD